MFGNHRKTIGVFINRSEMEFQQELIQGIVSESLHFGFNVVFMDSYGVRETKNMYDYYESAIVNFAPMEEFDAMIVALDTFDTPILRKKLIKALQDRAICTVAKAIYDAVQNKGFAARTGGDEFEVIIEAAKEEEDKLFCETVEKFLALVNADNSRYQVSTSIGSYCKRLDASDNYEDCIRISDEDMYRNKKNKRKK